MMLKCNIVPQPVKVAVKDGFFRLTANTVIVVDKETCDLGKQLAGAINPATGFALNLAEEKADVKNSIILRLDPELDELGDEGYETMGDLR